MAVATPKKLNEMLESELQRAKTAWEKQFGTRPWETNSNWANWLLYAMMPTTAVYINDSRKNMKCDHQWQTLRTKQTDDGTVELAWCTKCGATMEQCRKANGDLLWGNFKTCEAGRQCYSLP